MNVTELNNFLRQTTDSEVWHQRHPGELSKRFERITKQQEGNHPFYVFEFKSLIRNGIFAALKESRYAPVPPHRCTTFEMIYVYSGTAHYIIDGKSFTLGKGDICMIDTTAVRELEQIGRDDIIINLEMRRSYFTTSFLTQLSAEGVVARFLLDALAAQNATENHMLFRTHDYPEVQTTMTALLAEYFDPQLGTDKILSAYMLIIFSLLVREYQRHPQQQTTTNFRSDILPILQYIEAHYATVTLHDLASQFGYHPNYISAVLKHTLLKNFRQIKLEVQMKQATLKIKNTDQPIYDIATEVGFSNLGQFYRKFEEYSGYKPSQLRERQTNNH